MPVDSLEESTQMLYFEHGSKENYQISLYNVHFSQLTSSVYFVEWKIMANTINDVSNGSFRHKYLDF